MIYLTNSFSINMLKENCSLRFTKVSAAGAQAALMHTSEGVVNAIGHPDTDKLVRTEIEKDFGAGNPMLPAGKRMNVSLEEGDTVVVAQYRGPRLPEGATQLPEGATIEYWIVQTQYTA